MTTYQVSANTLTQTLAGETFSNLKKAKAWARQQVRDGVTVVISDADMPSRNIKLFKLRGENSWVGEAPESWFSA